MEKRRNILIWTILMVVILGMTGIFVHYISIAGSTVPIMDYWEWISNYGKKIVNNEITFLDFVINPDKSTLSAQHISPGTMALQFFVLALHKFDVRPLVTYGMIIKIITGYMLVGIFIYICKKNEEKLQVRTYLYAILMFAISINFNQWEILTEPFAFTFSIRIALYYISFYTVQHLYKKASSDNKQFLFIQAIGVGIFCTLITLLSSSAYFVGHLFSIMFVGIGELIHNKENRKEIGKITFVLGSMIVFAVIGYMYMIHLSASAGAGASTNIDFDILDVLLGVLVYMGTLLIPQTYIDTIGIYPIVFLGIVLLVVVCIVLIAYYKLGLDLEEKFPIMCIVYAGVTGGVIAVGRVNVFGIGTMASSRYVIESSLGLIGLIWMLYSVLGKTMKLQIRKRIDYIVCCVIMLGLIVNMKVELNIAPYRQIYNQELKKKMLMIDEQSDEDLWQFQNTPENVRWCVKFFEENKLSVFSE